MSLAQRIDAAIEKQPGARAKAIARTLVRNISRDEMILLLTEEVEHRMRARTRAVEAQAFRDRFAGGLATEAFGPEFKRLLSEPVKIGDGTGGLTFGSMTTEQHRQRIAMLSKLRDGLEETITRHVEAITMIEEAGVTCLNEITVAA